MIDIPFEYRHSIYTNVKTATGGDPAVVRYFDKGEVNSVDVMSISDCPQPGTTTWGTIGLSAYSIDLILEEDRELRCEFIGAAYSDWDHFGRILGLCAFNIIRFDASVHPGTVYPDLVSDYYPDVTMKHIMFHNPYLWGDGPASMDYPENHVTWLMAVPISDSEMEFRRTKGYDATCARFEKKAIDVLDLNRRPVVK